MTSLRSGVKMGLMKKLNKEIIKEIIILLIGVAVIIIFFHIIVSTIILWVILLRKYTESTANISLWGRSIFGVLWILATGYIFIFADYGFDYNIYSPEQSLLSKILLSAFIFQPLLWFVLLFAGSIVTKYKSK